MDWEGPRTQPSFWTPSIPPLERLLPAVSPLTTAYRALRLLWLVLTLPLHLTLVVLSLLPLSRALLPSFLYHGKLQRWNPQQRLVYPLLRRLIWAICDVGSPGALTPAEEHEVPLWAWLLEKTTVLLGGGAKVSVDVRDGRLPDKAQEDGWVKGEARDPRGEVGFEEVPLFWFEREEQRGEGYGKGEEYWRARGDKDRVIVYFVGGGFVTGNPTEGSRCFKLARETGLRVVGTNFRKATTPSQAFPAALQDALATYAYLVLTLGYRDIVLAGDSAGAGLAVNLLQYLALDVQGKEGKRPDGFVLPTGLLLFSPWCDLTTSHYANGMKSEYEDDIICASMATNSIRSYLLHVHRHPDTALLKAYGGTLPLSSVYSQRGRHPWFSPSLPSALPNLTAVGKAYLARSPSPTHHNSTLPHPPPSLRLFITTGRSELFHPEVHSLIQNFHTASRTAAVEAGEPSKEPLLVESREAEGEVHAFPLVPEWISPASREAWRAIRTWAVEGLERDVKREGEKAGRGNAIFGNKVGWDE
ncbi:hypothetical protein JCM8547_007104 [Rhodosporidiobolus lusitaniae]